MGRVPAYPYQLRPGARIGGGDYPRALAQPAGACLYRVRKRCAEGEFATVGAALAQWQADKLASPLPHDAVIEIADSASYDEAPQFQLDPGEHLQLRAASLMRPVLHLPPADGDSGGQIRIVCGAGSHLVLDGLLLAGGGIEIAALDGQQHFRVTLRHCTLVPGWDTEAGQRAPWRTRPSVLLQAANMAFRVNHSIVGPIRVAAGQPLLQVDDSIVDAGHPSGLAITDAAYGPAPAVASIVRSTLIGLAQCEQLLLAEESVFLGPLLATRRDIGSVRGCFVEMGSRTPPREGGRARPCYASLRYGEPGYGQLLADAASAALAQPLASDRRECVA